MAEERSPPGARLPTLTEVVDLRTRVADIAADAAADAVVPMPAAVAPTPAPAPDPLDEARLVTQVLCDLQQRIDLMFEYRLRETLAPVLARVTDAVIREARDELARTLRDVVARAVSQEVSKRRPR